MTGVQYVAAPTAGGLGAVETVPLPSPAIGGLALLGMMLMDKTRRSVRRGRSGPVGEGRGSRDRGAGGVAGGGAAAVAHPVFWRFGFMRSGYFMQK